MRHSVTKTRSQCENQSLSVKKLFLGFLRTILVALFSFHFSGCAINADLKDPSLSRAAQQTSEKKLQYGGGVGVLIRRILFFTLSESDSYLAGQVKLDTNIRFKKKAAFFLSNTQLVVSIWAQPRACLNSEKTIARLEEVLGTVFAFEPADMPSGNVDIYFVPDDVAVTNRFFAFEPGRKLSLKFFFPCADTNSQRDILAAVLHIAHEITHALLYLRGEETLARDETLADGAPSCIYKDIKEKGYADLLEALSEEQFFNSNPLTYEPDHPSKMDDWDGLCSRWKKVMMPVRTEQNSATETSSLRRPIGSSFPTTR